MCVSPCAAEPSPSRIALESAPKTLLPQVMASKSAPVLLPSRATATTAAAEASRATRTSLGKRDPSTLGTSSPRRSKRTVTFGTEEIKHFEMS